MTCLCTQDHKTYAAANQTATEAFTSIRTVAAFSLGSHLSAQYNRGVQGPRRAGVIKANTAGGSFGTSQFVLYASYGELILASLLSRLLSMPGCTVRAPVSDTC